VKPQLAILDVRTKAEYDAGHLKGAILVPVAELADRLSEVPMDRDILVYCRTGNRSRTAMEVLRQNGYTRLYHLKDGGTDWILKGYPGE
jgi:rhodanese-related sulfurtransferase